MSNFIIRQKGPSSVVADNIWDIRPGVGALLLGTLSGALIGLYLARRDGPNGGTKSLEGWPVNLAHRGGRTSPPRTPSRASAKPFGSGPKGWSSTCISPLTDNWR
jgi:hypothetical protein